MEFHFDLELENLRQKLLLMAVRAETAVKLAVQALLNRDADLALQVKNDDVNIDQAEVDIDGMAMTLLTKAPLATNLRTVAVAMRISQNLERVGDEATKIAKRARDLAKEPPLRVEFGVNRMVEISLDMLKSALDAYVNKDPVAARDLIPRDKAVDQLNQEAHELMVRQMTADPSTIGRGLQWLIAVKSLERIADHAKNIAEEVVYLCEAQDIRHTQPR